MNKQKIPQWLIRFALIVAVPSIACFGLYSTDYLDEKNGVWAVPAILAYPVALIGIGGLAMTLLSPKRSKPRMLLWTVIAAIPILFLLILRT